MDIKARNNIYLGFDFGLRKIGVAVGQLITKSASPMPILPAKDGAPNWQQLDKLIQDWQPCALVTGLPLNMDGSEHEITKAAKKFVTQLEERYKLPVHFVDERLTTKAAREFIYEQGGYKALQDSAIDSIAAKLILEDWLKAH
ncbi:MAG: Holliday junction resolvase RuvX [Gammaproteobacteria bacterium]|nr:Holliday junction resolvase RuvX [Gammaproteobacteria bacterium]